MQSSSEEEAQIEQVKRHTHICLNSEHATAISMQFLACSMLICATREKLWYFMYICRTWYMSKMCVLYVRIHVRFDRRIILLDQSTDCYICTECRKRCLSCHCRKMFHVQFGDRWIKCFANQKFSMFAMFYLHLMCLHHIRGICNMS